jgi:hypothetical protein
MNGLGAIFTPNPAPSREGGGSPCRCPPQPAFDVGVVAGKSLDFAWQADREDAAGTHAGT